MKEKPKKAGIENIDKYIKLVLFMAPRVAQIRIPRSSNGFLRQCRKNYAILASSFLLLHPIEQ